MTLITQVFSKFFIAFVQVAAGNGTSAMVTKDGDLYVFGKDSSQSDYTTGQVSELKGQIVTQVKCHCYQPFGCKCLMAAF